MITIFRNIKYGVRNLIKWFTIIWKDRDWDYEYLLNVMSFKMKNMAELHRKDGNSVNSEKYAEQLEECVKLIKRISTENYGGETWQEEDELLKKDLDFLFSNMRKNLLGWWD